MRLHQLTVTAFGPFAGTVEVDFDSLSAGGLFLLTGATGAGKTSVLDAVCFALYGQVPGDRSGAKHLRSDHAPADREPRVVLELSIGERRFRFTRSPAWSRPKRRGDGITSVPAHVVVEERRGAEWVARTNRLDDAGLLVGELLGMSCGQFVQVAMLPQGRFQAFLRASSAERHAVLQRLFRTDRFERVERWLVERRTTDRRASEAAADAVRAVLHRIEEASGAPAPEACATDLADAAEADEVRPWSVGLAEAAAGRVEESEALLAKAEEAESLARQALDDARARDSLVRRATAAAADLTALEEQADALAEIRGRLDRHRGASTLAPLVVRARTTADAHAVAVAALEDRVAALADLPDVALAEVPSRQQLTRALSKARTALATAEAYLPREGALEDGEQRLRASRTALTELDTDLEAAATAHADLPGRLAEAEQRREETAAAAAALAGVRARVEQLGELVGISRRLDRVTRDLDAARADLRDAIDVRQIAQEHHLNIREARINGMAAELAGALVSGCECPVCGSASHPSPASQGAGVIGREEETAARSAYETAAFAAQAHQVKIAGLESELTALTDRLGDRERDALGGELTRDRQELQALTALADRAEDATGAVTQVRARLGELTAQGEALRLRRATLSAEIAEREQALEALRAERTTLLDGRAIDVAGLVALRADTVRVLEDALAHLDVELTAARACEDAAGALADAAGTAGFADVESAIESLLDEHDAEALDRALAEAEARRITAEATLADPEVQEAAAAGAPELAALAETQSKAALAHRQATSRAAADRERHLRLAELDDRLAAKLTAWAPVRARHRLSAELSSLVEGSSRDNTLRMRLAAYVLAERLRQVVAAANERLSRMTGERYALEHVGDRGVGELRGGLSLRVRDDWNGVHRDPATLSGGETFVVSLALALGLADTVAHEAGGTDIDTLFIDEGFGSLDADTLEDVMDTLDQLRDGGRVVGLVSHVPELRNRITTQLEVIKGRNGSALRAVLAGN